MPCSICKQNGHNSRTCASELALPELFDEQTITKFKLSDLDVECNLNAIFDTEEKKECIVCYDEVDGEKVTIKCGHTYCVQCFVKHMRIQGTCAYCRSDICEPPNKTKTLLPDTRATIMDQFVNNSQDLIELIRGEFIHQMRSGVTNSQILQQNAMNSIVENIVIDTAHNANLAFSLWMVGVRASEYTSIWHERMSGVD